MTPRFQIQVKYMRTEILKYGRIRELRIDKDLTDEPTPYPRKKK